MGGVVKEKHKVAGSEKSKLGGIRIGVLWNGKWWGDIGELIHPCGQKQWLVVERHRGGENISDHDFV